MGKFVGWKCDVCGNAEDGNDAPVDWLRLKLPSNGTDNARDLCSDKCLLKFARERAGVVSPKSGSRKESMPGLREYFESIGLRPAVIGPKMRAHTSSQHETRGTVSDCPICEFQTRKEG